MLIWYYRELQSMKIKKDKKIATKSIVLALALIIALLLGYWYLSAKKSSTDSGGQQTRINYDPPTEGQIKDGQRTKEESVNGSNDTNNDSSNGGSTNITVTAKGTSDNIYRIRVFIDRISASGSCTLSLSSDGTELNNFQTVNTQALPEGSTCQGFDIPLDSLSDSSSWVALINYSDGDTSGSVSTEISL